MKYLIIMLLSCSGFIAHAGELDEEESAFYTRCAEALNQFNLYENVLYETKTHVGLGRIESFLSYPGRAILKLEVGSTHRGDKDVDVFISTALKRYESVPVWRSHGQVFEKGNRIRISDKYGIYYAQILDLTVDGFVRIQPETEGRYDADRYYDLATLMLLGARTSVPSIPREANSL